jgi:hypothetical protein
MEGAAPDWARWEAIVATWMAPATGAMLTTAGVNISAPGVLERLLGDSGLVDIAQRTMVLPLRMSSAAQALAMMQEAFRACRFWGVVTVPNTAEASSCQGTNYPFGAAFRFFSQEIA